MTGHADDESSTASEDRAELSLEAIPLHSTDLLTVLDADGVIQYESPSIEEIFGFDQAELLGEDVAGYFHPDDREDVLEAFRTVVDSNEQTVEAVEYRHETADGTYLWVESVASTNTMPAGYHVVNTRDISARKRREQELQRKNEYLDEFASVVGHDLRNPLNVAGLRLTLARKECNSEHLDDIEQAHDRMERLIENLLELARSGNKIDEPAWVSLDHLANRCWQNVETGDASLVVDTDRNIRADGSRLEQLLENLVRNAVEHGPNADSQALEERTETTEITVTIGELADGTGFYVSDNGAGIADIESDTVFDRGVSTSEEGVGLGLQIVAEIARAHDWEIEMAESETGGAQVEITNVEFE